MRRPVTPTTFLVASKDWLAWKQPLVGPRTHEIEALKLKRPQVVLGSLLITDITADDIADFQKARLAEQANPRTINMEVGVVRQVLKRHRLWANLQPDVRMLPTRDEIGKALSHEEEDRILAACGKSRSRALLPFVVVAVNTGMRYSEIRLLKWNQVDLIGARLTVGSSKTDAGSGRQIPLNTRALMALTAWATRFPERKADHYVFPTEGVGIAGDDETVVAHHTDPTVPIGSIAHAWQRAKRAGNVRVRFHDLRHTACTRLLEAGIPLMTVGQLLGWAGGTVALMAKRYGHIGSQQLQDAVAALDRVPTSEGQVTPQPPQSATVN